MKKILEGNIDSWKTSMKQTVQAFADAIAAEEPVEEINGINMIQGDLHGIFRSECNSIGSEIDY